LLLRERCNRWLLLLLLLLLLVVLRAAPNAAPNAALLSLLTRLSLPCTIGEHASGAVKNLHLYSSLYGRCCCVGELVRRRSDLVFNVVVLRALAVNLAFATSKLIQTRAAIDSKTGMVGRAQMHSGPVSLTPLSRAWRGQQRVVLRLSI